MYLSQQTHAFKANDANKRISHNSTFNTDIAFNDMNTSD